jgi:hypothetical protein
VSYKSTIKQAWQEAARKKLYIFYSFKYLYENYDNLIENSAFVDCSFGIFIHANATSKFDIYELSPAQTSNFSLTKFLTSLFSRMYGKQFLLIGRTHKLFSWFKS